MNDPVLEFVRNTPAYVFFGFLGVLTVIGLVFVAYSRRSYPTKEDVCKEARFLARVLVQREYFVVKVKWRMSGATLIIQTADTDRRRFELYISGVHPDYQAVMALRRLDRIRFSYADFPGRNLNPEEEAAYLRLVNN